MLNDLLLKEFFFGAQICILVFLVLLQEAGHFGVAITVTALVLQGRDERSLLPHVWILFLVLILTLLSYQFLFDPRSRLSLDRVFAFDFSLVEGHGVDHVNLNVGAVGPLRGVQLVHLLFWLRDCLRRSSTLLLHGLVDLGIVLGKVVQDPHEGHLLAQNAD